MKSNFRNGVTKGLLYYAIGALATWLSYVLFGWSYVHAPGLFHLVAFLFLLTGFVWALVYVVFWITGQKSKVNFGILTVHLVATLTIVIMVVFALSGEEREEYQPDPADSITISRDSETGADVVVNGNGDTLYFKKGDSVLIDRTKIDSTKH